MKQNKNFNFQSVSSTNEKMMIILSWIIVVIIVVLIGLYYGQQAREQDITSIKVESKSGGEISSDSNSRVEEGEMKNARETGSVLSDSMTLNKNELFTVQIGSANEGEYYDEQRAGEIVREFSGNSVYSKKIITNPDRKQYIVHVGLFKTYEEAKSLLNNVKLKNYPAQITITADPKSLIAFLPRPQEQAKKPDVIVSTADSKTIESIKSLTPDKKPEEKSVSAKAAAFETPEKAEKKIENKQADRADAVKNAKTTSAAVESAVKAASETPSLKDEIAELKKDAVPAAPAEPEKASLKADEKVPEKSVEKAPAENKPTITEDSPAGANVIAEDTATAPVKTDKSKKPDKKIKEEKAPETPKKEKAEKAPDKKKATPAPDAEQEVTAGDSGPSETVESAEDEVTADAAVPEKQTKKKSGFYIQLGTYKSSKNAEVLKSKLKKLGKANAAIVSGKTSSGDTVYRVRLEGYASREEAVGECDKLKDSLPDVTSPYISK